MTDKMKDTVWSILSLDYLVSLVLSVLLILVLDSVYVV